MARIRTPYESWYLDVSLASPPPLSLSLSISHSFCPSPFFRAHSCHSPYHSLRLIRIEPSVLLNFSTLLIIQKVVLFHGKTSSSLVAMWKRFVCTQKVRPQLNGNSLQVGFRYFSVSRCACAWIKSWQLARANVIYSINEKSARFIFMAYTKKIRRRRLRYNRVFLRVCKVYT